MIPDLLRRRLSPAVAASLAASLLAAGTAVVLLPAPAGAAADRPNTLAAARAGAYSAAGSTIRSTVDTARDQDWFKFRVTKTTRALTVLGGVPGDYTLAVYDEAGTRLGVSDFAGARFEKLLVPVRAGTYYVRVGTKGYFSKTKSYALRFKPLSGGVVALDQATGPEAAAHRVMATLYNNSARWQWIQEVSYGWYDAQGRLLRRDAGAMYGGDTWVIPPHGTQPFGWPGRARPKGATSMRIIKVSTTAVRPPATPLPAFGVSGVRSSFSGTGVSARTTVTGTASTSVKVPPFQMVIAQTFNANGTMTGWYYEAVTVAPGRPARFRIDVEAPRPNAIRVYANTAFPGQPVPVD